MNGGHERVLAGHVRLADPPGVLVQRGHERDVGGQHGEQRAVLEEAAAGDGQVVEEAVVAQVQVGVGQVGHGFVGARERAGLHFALQQLVGVEGQDEQRRQQDQQLGTPEEEDVVRPEGRGNDEVAVQTHEGRGHDNDLPTQLVVERWACIQRFDRQHTCFYIRTKHKSSNRKLTLSECPCHKTCHMSCMFEGDVTRHVCRRKMSHTSCMLEEDITRHVCLREMSHAREMSHVMYVGGRCHTSCVFEEDVTRHEDVTRYVC